MSSPRFPKISKLIWLFFMMAIMILYILLSIRLIDALFAGNIVLELICFFIAGIAWIFPAKWLMFKINRMDKSGKK